ncbi:MAG TPA: MBL fold metallo-hydrolase [Polyangia bacterium]|jgi:phosphoribosyl 1,2-cyclic phosphodiesterase|nr:MBL fold metallo-hydrolase [Polyangia bacterium]
MLVRFWGTRGSLPAPLSARGVRDKLKRALGRAAGRRFESETAIEAFIDQELDFTIAGTFGGNSACVEIETGSPEHLLCDMGTGMREFGSRMMAVHGPRAPQVYNVLLSHPHWDHIMGFPFFTPAYIPGNVIRIHSGHPVEEVVRRALAHQHAAPSFPVEFKALGATIEFVQLEPGRAHTVAGCTVRTLPQHHGGGGSYGYRVEKDGRSVVYSTDSEHKLEHAADSYPFVDFFRDADLVIFDAMYSLADAASVKEDWGHSSNIVGVELCQLAGARHLCMFHHEPMFDDGMLAEVLADTLRYEALARPAGAPPLRVSSAYDGLEIRL